MIISLNDHLLRQWVTPLAVTWTNGVTLFLSAFPDAAIQVLPIFIPRNWLTFESGNLSIHGFPFRVTEILRDYLRWQKIILQQSPFEHSLCETKCCINTWNLEVWPTNTPPPKKDTELAIKYGSSLIQQSIILLQEYTVDRWPIITPFRGTKCTGP